MLRLFIAAIGLGAVTSDAGLTGLAAVVVSLGTLIAGLVAYVRLRQERPKIVQEIAGMSESRLREELNTAWEAVDRLRVRERELQAEVGECTAKLLERDRTIADQAARITRLERIVRAAGLS